MKHYFNHKDPVKNITITAYHKTERMRSRGSRACDDPAEYKCLRLRRIAQIHDANPRALYDKLNCQPGTEEDRQKKHIPRQNYQHFPSLKTSIFEKEKKMCFLLSAKSSHLFSGVDA